MGNCCRYNQPGEYSNFDNKDSRMKISQEINRTLDIIEMNKSLKKRNHVIPKRKVEDNYKVIKILGTGLFSKVYLVKNKDNRTLAMKVIEKSNFKTRDHIQKILVEKEIMKNINHRNILKLYKTFQTEKNVYFILEYASKGILKNY